MTASIERRDCLHELISMYKAQDELRCCGNAIPLDLINKLGGLNADFLDAFSSWTRELHSPGPLYCPWKKCFAIIPRFRISGHKAVDHCVGSPFWLRRLCLRCKRKEHEGPCRQDEWIVDLAKDSCWKFRPSCGHLVEKASGCNHMTCRCWIQFCWG